MRLFKNRALGETNSALIQQIASGRDHFVWRTPEPTGYDFSEADNDFSTIGDVANTWYDLDLSAIVPAGASAVLLLAYIQDGAADVRMEFRKNGQSSTFQKGVLRTRIINQFEQAQITCGLDTNRKIEFMCTVKPSEMTVIFLTILGWWV